MAGDTHRDGYPREWGRRRDDTTHEKRPSATGPARPLGMNSRRGVPWRIELQPSFPDASPAAATAHVRHALARLTEQPPASKESRTKDQGKGQGRQSHERHIGSAHAEAETSAAVGQQRTTLLLYYQRRLNLMAPVLAHLTRHLDKAFACPHMAMAGRTARLRQMQAPPSQLPEHVTLLRTHQSTVLRPLPPSCNAWASSGCTTALGLLRLLLLSAVSFMPCAMRSAAVKRRDTVVATQDRNHAQRQASLPCTQ
ncbi:hypothetical protein BDU57DRAFT_201479 [Ampelomyces quisqualis]|uniref:Uncharacterized protein n=1 Tax=Ampelomyces quisqualis TaxID=50730 RepID=A0A6A5QVB0_AMPQU|nr:hypothetical protein BDU57DRAFT_201479 [Ampelomyces quisqualis]